MKKSKCFATISFEKIIIQRNFLKNFKNFIQKSNEVIKFPCFFVVKVLKLLSLVGIKSDRHTWGKTKTVFIYYYF